MKTEIIGELILYLRDKSKEMSKTFSKETDGCEEEMTAISLEELDVILSDFDNLTKDRTFTDKQVHLSVAAIRQNVYDRFGYEYDPYEDDKEKRPENTIDPDKLGVHFSVSNGDIVLDSYERGVMDSYAADSVPREVPMPRRSTRSMRGGLYGGTPEPSEPTPTDEATNVDLEQVISDTQREVERLERESSGSIPRSMRDAFESFQVHMRNTGTSRGTSLVEDDDLRADFTLRG